MVSIHDILLTGSWAFKLTVNTFYLLVWHVLNALKIILRFVAFITIEYERETNAGSFQASVWHLTWKIPFLYLLRVF